jgi:hypothetical protein
MARDFVQTDTASSFYPDGSPCSAYSEGATSGSCELGEGSAGSGTDTIGTSRATADRWSYEADTPSGGIGETSWPSGTVTVRISIPTGNSNLNIDEVWVCARTSGGANTTWGSATGLAIDCSAGVKTVNVTVSTLSSRATTDTMQVMVVLLRDAGHGTQNVDIDEDQTWNTPFPDAGQIVSVPVAAATSAAVAPKVHQKVRPGVASASSAAVSPRVAQTVRPGVASAATVAVSPKTHQIVKVGPAAAATAAITPAVLGDQIVTVPPAAATTVAVTPKVRQIVRPGVAAAATAAITPNIVEGQIVSVPPAAVATAALTPKVKQTVRPGVAAAASAAVAPKIRQTVRPGVASAATAALTPTVDTGTGVSVPVVPVAVQTAALSPTVIGGIPAPIYNALPPRTNFIPLLGQDFTFLDSLKLRRLALPVSSRRS